MCYISQYNKFTVLIMYPQNSHVKKTPLVPYYLIRYYMLSDFAKNLKGFIQNMN